MIDIDKLFEEYFTDFLTKNAGKFTEEELENKVGEIYTQFGNAKLKQLGGKSPKEYFEDLTTKELVCALEDCVKDGVSVSDFLCEEIEKREDCESYLLDFVNESTQDELATYAVNILKAKGSKKALSLYVELIKSGKAGESLIETVTETLVDFADEVKEEVLSSYKEGEKSSVYFVEILASMSLDDRVFSILIGEFEKRDAGLSLYASYLSKYGDERALPYLYKKLQISGLQYYDRKEIELAIENLGGEIPSGQEEQRHFKKIIH